MAAGIDVASVAAGVGAPDIFYFETFFLRSPRVLVRRGGGRGGQVPTTSTRWAEEGEGCWAGIGSRTGPAWAASLDAAI